MRSLVETLESTSNFRAHVTCSKQRRLFRALYDVAVKYIEVNGGQGRMPWSMARQQYADVFAGAASNGFGLSTINSGGIAGGSGTMNATDASYYIPSHSGADADGMEFVDGLVGPMALQHTTFEDTDMEMDLSGAQLWDWFNKNQSIMRMLEDA